MSLTDNTPPISGSQQLYALFSQLDARQVEVFYKGYQQWQLEQQSMRLQEQLASLEQQIVNNQVLLQITQPSAIALATLTRLQSLGVEDIDLLDNMLERGDTWLDHTLQLLEQCERLDVIHGNYTEWCRHALEDAYNWVESIHEVDRQEQPVQATTDDDKTEALLLQKLMSEETTETTSAHPAPDHSIPQQPVWTASARPSPEIEMPEGHADSTPTQGIPIPAILSYSMAINTQPIASTQAQEEEQKAQKYGLVSRMLARVWKA